MTSVAIIGGGPMAVYCLKHLLTSTRSLRITVFEQKPEAGYGTPYDPSLNSPEMLANITSVELPPIIDTLADWLSGFAENELAQWGVRRSDIHERAFFPRIVLGAYFNSQLQKLIVLGRSKGHDIVLCTEHHVVDIMPNSATTTIVSKSNDLQVLVECEWVIIATGYQNAQPIQHMAQSLSALFSEPPQPGKCIRIGILGTSLSAIDAAIQIATMAGQFDSEHDAQCYRKKADEAEFRIILMSRKGILPEADFYCPIPYRPLHHCTIKAAIAMEADGKEQILDRLFSLFQSELLAVDPGYCDAIGLPFLTADTFAEAYFAPRMRVPAIDWAKRNLKDTRANAVTQNTVAWRYAILRMHEVFGVAFSYMSQSDRTRFLAGLKGVFIDNYSAVPPLSIERLLSLHAAGHLSILRLGDDYHIKSVAPFEWTVRSPIASARFDAVFDARGQVELAIDELPFPSLKPQKGAFWQGYGQKSEYQEIKEWNPLIYSPIRLADTIFCLSVPYMMVHYPFVQGLKSCNEMSEFVAQAIQR